jgi:hypothetical protein
MVVERARDDGHVGAFRRHPDREGCADAAARARDDDTAALQATRQAIWQRVRHQMPRSSRNTVIVSQM